MYLPDFSKSRILVAGDIMLDRYWSGSTSRISPEAPVPIVKINNTENRLGGAANVAFNLRSLGCQTSLFGIIGKDKPGAILRELLDSTDIKHNLHQDPNNPTITKLRVMSQHQQLIRLDFEERLQEVDKNLLLAEIETDIASYDAVVISDYAKGTINDARYLIDLCSSKNIPVLVDPKGVDYSRYAGATILTPNRKELETIIGKQDSLEALFTGAEELCRELNITALIITLSEQGMALVQQNTRPIHIPTQAKEVFDVTGAGDTVISTLAAAIASNMNIGEAMRLANAAAGLVVGKSGTAAVSRSELAAELNHPKHKSNSKIVSLESLLNEIETSKAKGEKIVFTNGCFDILHVGHIRYLQDASRLGDKLIVALNSDSSVSRLKGPARPVVSLTERAEVIAALACIDWVVSFDEDTPEKLIQEVLPDVLVKGGDYNAAEVVGYDIVTQHGGEVVIMPYHDNHSTTSIIKKIKS